MASKQHNHGGQQNCRRIEREEDRADYGEQYDEDPEQPTSASPPFRRALGDDPEQFGVCCKLRDQGNCNHKQKYRPHPLGNGNSSIERKHTECHQNETDHQQSGAEDCSAHCILRSCWSLLRSGKF